MTPHKLTSARELPYSYLYNIFKVFKTRRTDRVSTRPTKEGITFLALSIFVGVAALNTGNNLLYLIFGMMLSFIAISGFMSMINLSRIDVRSLTPQNIFALTPISFKLFITNKKILLPSYSITVEVDKEKGFISYLPAKATKKANIRCFFKQRGWNEIPDIYISTSFPFGFFRKKVLTKTVNEEVLVYPKIEKIDIKKSIFNQWSDEKQSAKTGLGSDIRSIRTYRDGDNPKLIHWKSSAKIGELMIRELHDDESKSAVIEFSPSDDKTKVEIQITRAASLLLELVRHEYEVEFIAPNITFSSSEIGRSPRPVLRYLALYDGGGLA
ncbi:MAG: DUF58 domain-containing protein [Thermodesulfobacteriota bacterium]